MEQSKLARMRAVAVNGDVGRRTALVLAVMLIAVKLALTSMQELLITPNLAPLDDTLMYKMAVSIADGQWLGPYNWLNLSKYMLFPVWLAALHTLGIPYLLGGQLLYTAASAVGAAALWPAIEKRWARVLAFAVLLYNPAATAAQVQLRIYRDNITPALALLLLGGFIGYALRRQQPMKQSWPWLLAAGAGLAGTVLNREDGIWVLPFAVVAAGLTGAFLFWDRMAGKWGKALALAIPFAVLAAGVLAFCAINQQYYGRFILSDFTSSEFNDAYGALTRVQAGETVDKVPVNRQARELIYEHSPLFASIQPYLENEQMYNSYGSVPQREFYGGGFYWALRDAVSKAGYYADAQTACDFYRALADEVNALCDRGVLPAGPERSGTTPPIRGKDVLPTLAEGLLNAGRVLTFQEAEPAFWDVMSEQMYAEPALRQEYEDWLGSPCNYVAQENANRPYYPPIKQIAFKLLTLVQYVYAVALPAAFAVALWWLVSRARRVWENHNDALCWLICLGLLLYMLLRCMMIAFLFVTSFNNVPRIMYLAAAHPMALLFALLGCGMLARQGRKSGKGKAHG